MAPYRPKSLDELNNQFDKVKSADRAIKQGRSQLSAEAAGKSANTRVTWNYDPAKYKTSKQDAAALSGSVDSFIKAFSEKEKPARSAFDAAEQHLQTADDGAAIQEASAVAFDSVLSQAKAQAVEAIEPAVAQAAAPVVEAPQPTPVVRTETATHHTVYQSPQAPVKEGELSGLMEEYMRVMNDEDDDEDVRGFRRRRKDRKRAKEQPEPPAVTPPAAPFDLPQETLDNAAPPTDSFADLEIIAPIEGFAAAEPVEAVSAPEAIVAPVEEVIEPETIIAPTEVVVEPEAIIEPVEEVVEPEAIIAPIEEVIEPEAIIAPTEAVVEPEAIVAPIEEVIEPEAIITPTEAVVEPETIVEPIEEIFEPDLEPAETMVASNDLPEPLEAPASPAEESNDAFDFDAIEDFLVPETIAAPQDTPAQEPIRTPAAEDDFPTYAVDPDAVVDPRRLFTDAETAADADGEPQMVELPELDFDEPDTGFINALAYPTEFEDIQSYSTPAAPEDQFAAMAGPADTVAPPPATDAAPQEAAVAAAPQKKERHPLRTFGKVIVSLLLVVSVLATLCVSLLGTVFGINTGKPAVGNYYLFTASYSYTQANIHEGDLVICEGEAAVENGSSVVYIDADSHSFSFGVKEGQQVDSYQDKLVYEVSGATVYEENLLGRVAYTLPQVGTYVRLVLDNFLMLLIACAVADIVFILLLVLLGRKKRVRAEATAAPVTMDAPMQTEEAPNDLFGDID